MSAARPARFGYALGERQVPFSVGASRRPNRPAPALASTAIASAATATAITTITTITAAATATITTITAVGAPSLASSSCRPTVKADHHRG